MRRWIFLLHPSWLALAAVALTFAYLCFTVLAPWQLGKNTATSRENTQLQRALTAEPVPVTTLLPDQDSAAPDAQWQKVSATGHYLPDAQVLVRLRVVEGEPAFEVLVPFVVEGGPTVLVNRGYVHSEQASRVPAIRRAPENRVSIVARLRDPQPPIPGKDSLFENGTRQIYSVDTAQVAALTGVPLTVSYLQLTDDQPGGLGVIGLPHLDSGPFLSYGIQWIAFGILAPIGLGYFIVSEVRARRKADDDTASADTDPAAAADTTVAPTVAVSVEEKLADRYGRRR